jgi:hypothetical protein
MLKRLKEAFFAAIAVALMLPAVAAATTAALPIDSAAAAANVEKMIATATERPEDFRQQIDAMIDFTLHILRGPVPDGSGYQYAEAIIDKTVEPETLLSERVNAVWKANQQQTFAAEARTAYMLQIHAPKYRSGLFRNNGDTYVEKYKVEFSIQGKTRTINWEHKNWISRDSTVEIPLPGIAEWAKIEIVAGVEASDVGNAIIELRALRPIVKDDPKNPFSYSIDQLKSLQKNIAYAKSEAVLAQLNEALAGIKTAPVAAASSQAPSDQAVVQKLEFISYLMDGSEEEREKAKAELKSLIESMKKN